MSPMKRWKSKAGLLLGILAAFIAGYVTATIHHGVTVTSTLRMSALMERASLEVIAHEAYRSGRTDWGIGAMTALACILYRDAEIYGSDEPAIYGDLVLTHARLAKLFKTSGDQQRYRDNLATALELASRHKRGLTSEEELFRHLAQVDAIASRGRNQVDCGGAPVSIYQDLRAEPTVDRAPDER